MDQKGAVIGALSFGLLYISCLFGCNQPFSYQGELICSAISKAPDFSDGAEKVTINQGVWGDVRYWEGDFMPHSSSPANHCPQGSGTIKNVKREIVIFPLVNPISNPTSVQTDSVGSPFYVQINISPAIALISDAAGFYESTLAPGSYSVFVKETYLSKTYFYANTSDGSGNLQPINIVLGQNTHFPINITYASTQ